MPLRDSVDLVRFAFENARQGDLFIRKAPAATIGDLAQALIELFEVPDHEVQIIGWRHAEKLYETLASEQELATAEDMGDYWRLQLDERDLNYRAYFSEGDAQIKPSQDFHSHNAERLDVERVKALLMSLPEVQQDLAMWNSALR
jgi:UDP-glucose 4-epimerase